MADPLGRVESQQAKYLRPERIRVLAPGAAREEVRPDGTVVPVQPGDSRIPWKRDIDWKWPVESSEGIFNATQATHENLIEATGGRSLPNPRWRLPKSLLTLHPLGGCVMGPSPETGVIGHLGRTFRSPNPIVAGGAIVPAPTVRNPWHTIAALEERIAAHVA